MEINSNGTFGANGFVEKRDDVQGLGDQGQRYEVRAKWMDNTVKVIGWTNRADGGNLAKRAAQAPGFREVEAVDRFPGIENILQDWTKFKAGCRKCISDLLRGKRFCSYCNKPFPEARQ